MSHQLDGKRAGFINKKFDLMCMDKIVDEPEALTKMSTDDLVREAGAQGPSSSCGWPCAAPDRQGQAPHNYHIPISNTAAGMLLLENAA